MPRLHSGAATDRPEITHLTPPPIPEVVWQQPKETDVTNIHKTLTKETQTNTQMPDSKQRSVVESQTSPLKKLHPKYPYPVRNYSQETKLGAHQYTGSMTLRSPDLKSKEMKST